MFCTVKSLFTSPPIIVTQTKLVKIQDLSIVTVIDQMINVYYSSPVKNAASALKEPLVCSPHTYFFLLEFLAGVWVCPRASSEFFLFVHCDPKRKFQARALRLSLSLRFFLFGKTGTREETLGKICPAQLTRAFYLFQMIY